MHKKASCVRIAVFCLCTRKPFASKWLYFAFAQENLLCQNACIFHMRKKTSCVRMAVLRTKDPLCLNGCTSVRLHKKTSCVRIAAFCLCTRKPLVSEWLYFAFAQENFLCQNSCILSLHKKTSCVRMAVLCLCTRKPLVFGCLYFAFAQENLSVRMAVLCTREPLVSVWLYFAFAQENLHAWRGVRRPSTQLGKRFRERGRRGMPAPSNGGGEVSRFALTRHRLKESFNPAYTLFQSSWWALD